MGIKSYELEKQKTDSLDSYDCLVIDTTGELSAWYYASDIVVIGKSFLANGGQNPVEAVFAEKPVLLGPNMQNFASLTSDLIAKGVKPQYYFISGSGSKQHFTKKNLKLISKSLNEEQKKYNIKLSGGDTVRASKVSFSITTIGFSKYIVERNKAKLNDCLLYTSDAADE